MLHRRQHNFTAATFIVAVALCLATFAYAKDLPKSELRTQTANDIQNYLDKTINPCDNFFKFACGNWKNTHPLPPNGQLDITGFTILGENIQYEIKEVLESPETQYNEIVDRKVKDFYKSCINTDLIKTKGNQPLKKLIESFGDFPLTNQQNWDEASFNFVDIEQKLKPYGFNGLIGLRVLQRKDKLFIGEIDLPMPKGGYQNPQVIEQYTQRVQMFLIKTFEINNDEALKIANEIVGFEKELSKLIVFDEPIENEKESNYVHTTIKELNDKYPKLEIQKQINSAFGKDIEPTTSIVELNPNYLNSMSELVEKTPKRTIANYMIWHALGDFIEHTTVPNANNDQQLIWKFCSAKTKEFYPKEIAVMYSRKYYNNDIQKDIEELFNDVKETVKTKIQQYDWIDDAAKKLALERIGSAKIEIMGYPQGVDVPIADDFNTIDIKQEEYIENVLNKLKYNTKLYRSKTLNNENLDNYIKDPASLTARYNLEQNVLQISIGFLNPPFYTIDLPRNMKFAQLGTIFVHELLHSVDQIGQNTPINGVNPPWWSESSIKSYRDKEQCFLNQYSKYGGGANVNDNGGLKYAFDAYQKWLDGIKENPEKKTVYDEEIFPNIDYTPKQLYFITHAQTWCHYAKPTAQSNEFIYPNEYRINIPMMNYDSFGKEFQCPEDSPMNPKEKCVLW